MNLTINRRQFIAGGICATSLAMLGGRRAFAQDKTALRLLWWGSQSRAERTFKVIDLYTRSHPDIAIEGESTGWSNYWPRLATQTSGGNSPDIIQMDYRYIFEYARRGVLAPMDPFIESGALDVTDFSKIGLDGGRVDNKLYGVNLGQNSATVVINKAAWQEAGLDIPHAGMTWEDYGEQCEKLTRKTQRRNFYGCTDEGGQDKAFECWQRQNGKELYTDDGKLDFGEKEITEWFEFWADMRKRQACVPADIQSLSKDTIDTNPLSTGHAATCFVHSNQIVGYIAINKDPLAMTCYPVKAGKSRPGQYLKPSQFFSIANSSDHGKEAAEFISFFVNDPVATKVLGVERGVPVSAAVRKSVQSELGDGDKMQVDYIASLGDDLVGPLPPAPPLGAGEIEVLFKQVNEQVGFDVLSPAEAGARLVEEASQILDRN